MTVTDAWYTNPDISSEYEIVTPVSVEVTEDDVTRSLSPERFELSSSTVIFLDENGRPEKLTGEVDVHYAYVIPGYDGVAVERVVADIGDNDTNGVMILPSNGSTDVIEVSDRTERITGVLQSGADRLIHRLKHKRNNRGLNSKSIKEGKVEQWLLSRIRKGNQVTKDLKTSQVAALLSGFPSVWDWGLHLDWFLTISPWG